MAKTRIGFPTNAHADDVLKRAEGVLGGVKQDVALNGLRRPEVAPQIDAAITDYAQAAALTDYTTARDAGAMTSAILLAAIDSALGQLETLRDAFYPNMV